MIILPAWRCLTLDCFLPPRKDTNKKSRDTMRASAFGSSRIAPIMLFTL